MSKPSFVYVTYIEATPEKVWNALTDPEMTKAYWVRHRNQSDWKPGSAWRHEGRGAGVRAASAPLVHVAGRLPRGVRKEKPSRVTFEIEPIGAEVKLTITHDEFEPDSKVHEAVGNGWPVIMASLKRLLETGRALAMTSPEAMENAKRKAVALAEGKPS